MDCCLDPDSNILFKKLFDKKLVFLRVMVIF